MDISRTKHRNELLERFKDRLTNDSNLNRKLISFQANKSNPVYRWFKYKEGFSSNLVQYYILKFGMQGCDVLDPYAGIGTTLFVSSKLGCNATGIELLPVGIFVMKIRELIHKISAEQLIKQQGILWEELQLITVEDSHINHIPITKGAFPSETEIQINKYLEYCKQIGGEVGELLRFALFCVLEDISYTRKDGQYLRWDSRSGRSAGKKPFDKGKIMPFREAVDKKLSEIIADVSEQHPNELELFKIENKAGTINILQDSILTNLPQQKEKSFDLIITSPPYANRYDYTRTYALELVFLNNDNEKVKELRQSMLSCTVENKEKKDFLRAFYTELNRLNDFENILTVYQNNKALHEVLEILEEQKQENKLNNKNIVNLIQNYFLESCFTIFEMSRVLRDNGKIIMVNDNVRYGGEEIPVDLILSDFAENFGLQTKNIFILQQKKGNSSQQMGNHGREALRKCVYLWQK